MKPEMHEVNEQKRTYYFPDFQQIVLDEIIKFSDSATTHRLEDKNGNKWIIPKTFLAIKLEMLEWSL